MTILKHIDFEVPGWGELQQAPKSRLSYRGEVMADSPLMYLRLGESSGVLALDETGRHHANVDGTVTWSMPGPLVFDENTAVSSAGTGGFTVSDTGWLPIGALARTIELWCKPNQNTQLFRGINYGVNSSGERVNFSYTASEVSVAVGNCRFGVLGLSLADSWHHFVLVFPDGATKCEDFLFYLDGQPLAASVIGGNGATAINTADTPLMINHIGSGSPNSGEFNEVAVYDSALSAQRTQDHYAAGTDTGVG